MKKLMPLILLILIIFIIIFFFLDMPNKKNEEGKVNVIATLFPQYDFVRQIGKEKVNVSLLLPTGVEGHTYEPTPQDIIKINNSDMFVYTGENMEPWAKNLSDSITNETLILDVSNGIELIQIEEEQTQEHHEHVHSKDPHIWLNPINAIKMVENITTALCQIDKENSEYYRKNAQQYISQLNELDKQTEQLVEKSINKKIVFGGEFSYIYFIKRYNLEYISAYDSCGEGSEPSVSKIKEVIEYIKQNNIKTIFFNELTNGKVAQTITQETQSQMLIFHNIDNISKKDLDSGITYLDLMNQNLNNLKQALNY